MPTSEPEYARHLGCSTLASHLCLKVDSCDWPAGCRSCWPGPNNSAEHLLALMSCMPKQCMGAGDKRAEEMVSRAASAAEASTSGQNPSAPAQWSSVPANVNSAESSQPGSQTPAGHVGP